MKKKFKLEAWPGGICDIMVGNQKVVDQFNATKDHIALKVPNWVEQNMVKKVPHDPRITSAPRGADKTIELQQEKDDVCEDDRNQIPAPSGYGRINQSEQNGKRCDQNDSPRRRSSVRLQSSGE